MEENEDLKEMTPYQYFQFVKSKVNEMNDENLNKLYSISSELLEKYKKTGQVKAAKKLAFHIKSILKEKEIIDLGITKFVYRDDIENYIDNIAKDVVKIIELKNYPREILDELVEIIEKTKDIFDEMYVLFTDYTGEVEKKVEKERDPILFGSFIDRTVDEMSQRMYYLGDWIDEYCDLTLDKLVSQTNKSIVKEISIPNDTNELINQLNKIQELSNEEFRMTSDVIKPHKFLLINKIINKIKGK